MFNAVDFLKADAKDRMDILCNIINFWENDRIAVESEYLYNLNEEEDANVFANIYGFKTAMECYKEGNYWFGGTNFKKPIKVDMQMMYNIINDAFDEEYFDILIDAGYKSTLMLWFNLDKIIEYNMKIFQAFEDSDVKKVNTIEINLEKIKSVEVKEGKVIISYTE